jgi:predicted GH43/DUF377 family glycosyl hydrolase
MPTETYEAEGFFANVVFTCGLLAEDRKLRIYYGAADTSVCYAEVEIEQVLASLLK